MVSSVPIVASPTRCTPVSEGSARRLRLLVIDDSVAQCRFFEHIFSLDQDIDVVGFAHDAWEARQKIKSLEPDVVTLDIGLPGMDGLKFLHNLMRLRPMPVVVISGMTTADSSYTQDALRLGAMEVLHKRLAATGEDIATYRDELAAAVKRVGARRDRHGYGARDVEPASSIVGYRTRGSSARRASVSLRRVIAIGTSTGGPAALKTLLAELRAPGCAVVIVQHMPERFLPTFAARLDSTSKMPVTLLSDGELLLPDHCYVVPGNRHAILRSIRGELCVRLLDEDAVNGHRPSVGVLFDSVANTVGSGAIGVLLTGMGHDGSRELGQLHATGALTMVQDEATSIVWGMPGRAAKSGHADMVLPIEGIAPMIDSLLSGDDAA